MDKFSVGEVAIINSLDYPEYNGLETTITGKFEWDSAPAYNCDFDPRGFGWYESSLRKKKPPQELSTWQAIQELTNWNPTKETIE